MTPNPTKEEIDALEREIQQQRKKRESRVDAEIKLLKFHTPQMQSTSVDMTIVDDNRTLSERLARLAAGEDIKAPDE